MFKKISSYFLCSLLVFNLVLSSYSVDSYASGVIEDVWNGVNKVWIRLDELTRAGFEGADSFVRNTLELLVPDVYFYNDYNTVSSNIDNRTYNSYIFKEGDTSNYSMYYTQDNSQYIYNPVTNQYDIVNNTYYYTDDRDTYYYEDNNYYYATTNNITDITYYVMPKVSSSECRQYSYYYQLPDGSNSYNLTKNDIYGQYMSYGLYKYETASEDSPLLGLFHLDGTFDNAITNSDLAISYNGNTYGSGRFDGGLYFSGTNAFTIDGSLPDKYTVEYWLYNAFNNSYTSMSPYGSWVHCVFYVDGSSVNGYFNGVPLSRISNYANRVTYKSSYTTTTHNPYFNWSGIGDLYSSTSSVSSFSYNLYNTVTASGTNSNYYVSTGTYRTVGSKSLSYNRTLSHSGVSGGLYPNFSNGIVLPFSYNSSCSGTNRIFSDRIDTNCSFSTSSNVTTVTLNSLSRTADTRSSYYNFNFGDLYNYSSCIIDEIRISDGFIYGDDFNSYQVPLSPFSNGEIFVAPSGSNYNFGDIAVMTTYNLTQSRVGGALYPYPQNGYVYISLNDSIAESCRVYHNGAWYYCNFAIWNGTQWQNGVGFDFSKQQWLNNNRDVNVNIDINVDVEDIDGADVNKLIDFITDLPKVFMKYFSVIKSITFVDNIFFQVISVAFTLLFTLIIIKLLRR